MAGGTEAGRVFFNIGADSSEADQEVKRSFGDMAKTAVKLAAAILIAKKAFDTITSTMTEATKAASFADETITDLAASMARAGEKDVRAATEDFVRFAGEVQNVTGISDEAISKAGTLGASFGITGDKLKKATLAAVDMAKVMKSDVSATMSLVARAASSGTNALSRYGIEMTASEDAGVRLDSILASINEKFGGAAANAVNTYAGRVKILQENYGDLQEELGRSVTQSETFNALIVVATEETQKLFAGLQENRGWLEGWMSSAVSLGATVATTFVTVGENVRKAFEGIRLVANLVIAGIMELPIALQTVIEKLVGLQASALDLIPGMGGVADKMREVQGAIIGQRTELEAIRDVFASSAADADKAWDDIGKGADESRAKIEAVTARVRELQATLIVDPIAAAGAAGAGAGGGVGPGAAGAGGATDRSALEESIFGQDSVDNLNELYKTDAENFRDAHQAKIDIAIAAAAQMAQAFGVLVANMVQGNEITKESAKDMGLSIASAVNDAAAQAIIAYAASAAAAAAFANAGIPIVGPIIAVAAATTMAAFVRSFLGTFHDGGIVGGSGSGRDVAILAEKGELILPTDVTRAMIESGRQRRIPALAGGGAAPGGGDTFISNHKSFLPPQSPDLARATREQFRMQKKLKRRGVLAEAS